MHKRAVALMLSVAIININSYGAISYAADYIEENISKQEEKVEAQTDIEQEEKKQEKTQREVNSYSVYNTEELKRAISTAVEGDTIKVYPGNYTEDTITISNPGITLQGYTSSGELVTDKVDAVSINTSLTVSGSGVNINAIETKNLYVGRSVAVDNVSIKNSYVVGHLYLGNGKGGEVNNTKVDNTDISMDMNLGTSRGIANNTTLTNVKSNSLMTYAGQTSNTTIEGCEIRNMSEFIGNNFNVRNTKLYSVYIKGNDSTIEGTTLGYLYLANEIDANNITIRDTNITGHMYLGRKGGTATNILVDNVTSFGASIGYDGGNASDVTIRNSNFTSDVSIGSFGRGRATNTQIFNSELTSLYIGKNTGVSENTKIMGLNIAGSINIGDSESKAENTLIQTDSKNITDNGRNTTIINTLLSNSPKITGQASQGQRIEIIKEGNKIINKTVESDNLIDWYIDENDQKFTLNTGDQLQIKIYNSSDELLFDESIVVEKNTTPPSTPSINRVDNTSTKITGKSEINTTVVAKVGDAELGRVKTDADGNFEITLNKPLKEYTIIEVYAMDKDGNISNTVHRDVSDVIRPDAPQVNQVTTKSNTITGKAEPYSRVTVELNANVAMQKYEGKADKDGNFQVSLGKLVRKNDTIDVYAMDSALNKSDIVRANTIEVLPQAPIINETVSNASKTINGTSDSNCDIYAYIDGGLAMAATSDNQGKFTLTAPWVDEFNIRIPAGTQIEIVAIDEDRDKSNITTITVQDVRPKAVSKIDEVNNTSNTINGKAEVGKEVIAFVLEEEIGRTTTDSEGNFQISLQNTLEQDREVRFVVAGENDILSEIKSTTVKDKIAPTIEFIDEVANDRGWISGKAEPASTIYVLREGQNEDDENVWKSRVYDTGFFEVTTIGLVADETLRIYAKDASDNRSEIIEVRVLEKTSPNVSISAIFGGNKVISGQTRENSDVVAYLVDKETQARKEIGTSKANKEGKFEIEINEKLRHGDYIIVKATDIHGNTGESLRDVVGNPTPYFERLDDVNTQSTEITGKVTESGVNILVRYKDPSGNYLYDLAEGKADENGNFSINIPKKLEASYTLSAVAYDGESYSYEDRMVYYIKEFKDIEKHWAREQIYSFIDKGYINGYQDDTFKPDNQITRAEFVKIVNGVFGYLEKGEVKFSDVEKSDWYYDEVAKAVKAGYINGKSETSFDPMAPITRQEAAKIIATIKNCADDNHDKISSFDDSATVASWAKSYVEGVVEAGYMNGYSDNTFKPEQRITRAEAVVTLQRTIN